MRRYRAILLCLTIYLSCCGATLVAQFETRSSISTGGCGANCAAVADFNKDGKLDFVVAYNSVELALGKGDGTFQTPISILNIPSNSVLAADFNRDGKLDMAVTDFSGLSILLGNGDGTFQSATNYVTACTPVFAATGDFNGDHKLDLVVTYSSGNCTYVSIFLGNGDGTFQSTPINTTPSSDVAAIGVGDFNSDGKSDLAVAEQFGTLSQVEILIGNGDGTFSATATYHVDPSPSSIAIADFRGNGKLDFAVACLFGGTNIFLGNGDGTFAAGKDQHTLFALSAIASDFNGDGKPDLAVVQLNTPAGVTVLIGNGDGTFQPPTFFPAGGSDFAVAAGDFNGDHQTDLLVLNSGTVSAPTSAITLLNTGVATFSPSTPVNYPFQRVGIASPSQTVTLTNTGKKPLNISSARITGPFHQANNCGRTVAPGAQCAIKFSFIPTTIGAASGSLILSDNASSKPQVIELTGAGTVVNLSPLRLTFGDQNVGTSSPPQAVTLVNTGSTSLTVSGFQSYTRDYSETDNCTKEPLAAGASCTINVTFAPQRSGTRPGVIQVFDTGGASPQSIRMTGTGT